MSNGWLLQIIYFACSELNWELSYVLEDVSLVWILLLFRQRIFNESKNPGFSLLEQEMLDENKDIPWEEQVRQNRIKLSQMM